jgi:excisionase family DNA binding protein
MSALLDNIRESVAPSAAEALAARESARRLAPVLAENTATVELRIGAPGRADETVTIPASAFRMFVHLLDEMASGNAVRLIPHNAELSTQEAAEILNVSRPFVVRLLDEGRIASHRVGTHRRVLLTDVMEYRDEHRRARGAVLDRLSALDQELGLV